MSSVLKSPQLLHAFLLVLAVGCSRPAPPPPPPSTAPALPVDAKPASVVTVEPMGMTFRLVSPREYGFDQPDFLLLETEVTNAMYRRYLDATGAEKGDEPVAAALDAERAEESRTGRFTGNTGAPSHQYKNRALLWRGNVPPPGTDDYPVALVNPEMALRFCEWLTRSHPEHGTFRLPSRREWLVAAYGKDRPYPWGEQRDPARVPVAHPTTDSGRADVEIPREPPRDRPEPGKSRPGGRTPEGLYGMWGNVGELVLPEERLRNNRVRGLGAKWMGGDFGDGPVGNFEPRKDYWGYTHHPDVRQETIGFRVLLDPTEAGRAFRHVLPKDAPFEHSVYDGTVER